MPAAEMVQDMEGIDKLSPTRPAFDFGINLDFSQGPSSTFSNLVLLANNYLNQQQNGNNNNAKRRISHCLDENEPGETSESSVDRDEKEKSPTILKQKIIDISHPCTICKMEPATVSHFNVDVCTGCRAFFRRSVSQQKTYRCLNSKLCGKTNLVPNRRVCKFCRFSRCIDAGMLKSKEQLYNQKLDNPTHKVSTTSSSSSSTHSTVSLLNESPTTIISFPSNATTPADSVMEHFLHFRRKITYDRLQTYYGKNKLDENAFIDCNHTVGLGLRESHLIVEILSRSPVFDGISAADQRILFGDYSVVWTVHEQVLSTVRNGGHLTKKIFFPDGTNLRLSEETAFKYWQPLFATIKDKRPVITEMVGRFLLNLATYTTLEISRFMVSASMNEEELAAFTALLFLRPEILSAVSPESRTILSQRRHQLLHNLSNYLISIGQKVDERMPKIILLISEMQTAIRMLKHAINIIRVTTSEDSILPKSYIELFEEGARDISSLLNTTLPVHFK